VIPALYNLAAGGLLPDNFCVVGVARKAMSNDAMRAAWMLQKGCEAQAEALLRPRANE